MLGNDYKIVMNKLRLGFILSGVLLMLISGSCSEDSVSNNKKDDGYRGIWYMNLPLKSEYKYKYSGGLGTYCAKHKPFAVYSDVVGKTFFCYGGTTKDSNQNLVHMVSYYDHKKKIVPRPTILMEKKTGDAHDNPVISMDDEGYIWIFSTSHGTERPSYIYRSKKPYNIDAFDLIDATRLEDGKEVPIANFSYFQAWHIPQQGFVCFFSKYGLGSDRTICFIKSADGIKWSAWQVIAAVKKGYYQISGATGKKAASAFNYHPDQSSEVTDGSDYRTNLYYIETNDLGDTWTGVRTETTTTAQGGQKRRPGA